MSGARRFTKAPDATRQHRDWLSLVEVTGSFLSLPVLRRTWPALDALDRPARERLRREHGEWQSDPGRNRPAWIDYVLRELLGWREALHHGDADGVAGLAVEVAEHETTIEPSFALAEPGTNAGPDTVRLLGLITEAGQQPTARVRGSAWAATPVDRIAHLCRHHGVPLGLVTDGRWWALVWAPRGSVTTTAVFDAVDWASAAERDVVRAFVSLLCRRRFFGVREDERLPALLEASKDNNEDITEALGVQVRRAVELLVAAIGRADMQDKRHGRPGIDASKVTAHEVYRGAVAIMMRVVFLLFAEERGLLPAGNELYLRAYSAGRLAQELQRRADEGSETDLEHSSAAWHRLLALFEAVYRGVDHPRLRMHAHGGSIFDPDAYPWLPLSIDDRTVLHMLNAVQHVWIGTGKSRERRTLSFRTLDVEQIGYVYEGLLSYEGFRASDTVVGLVGKEGVEAEVPLTELAALATAAPDTAALADTLAQEYKDSRIGSASALRRRLAPLGEADRQEAWRKLHGVTGDPALTERLLPFYGIIRRNLRDEPIVVLPGGLYVTESRLRKNTGTHYTPRDLAESIVKGALEPLVFAPGPLQTANREQWRLRSSAEILDLKVADIAMGSAAFLVAACRFLADRLLEAWSAEGNEEALAYRERAGDRLPDADEDPVVIRARRLIIEHCLYGADINEMAVEMAKLSLWLVSMDPERPFTFVDDRLVVGDSLLGITSLDQLEVLHMDARRGRELHEGDLFEWTAGVRGLVAEAAEERRHLAAIDGATLAGLAKKREILADAEGRTERLRLFADLATGAALAYAKKGETGPDFASLDAAALASKIAANERNTELQAHDQRRIWLATDQPDGAFDRRPIHWPLVFPEVFEKGGFDAIIGNPPFLGGKKITGSYGIAYREYLVDALARGVRGHADLVAYFALRIHRLINAGGQVGLIATNTLAQGDTREVGLDQIVNDGVAIKCAIKSRPWPSKSAVLEYCAVWTSRAYLDERAERRADDAVVRSITSSLESATRVSKKWQRLAENSEKSFIGSYVLGSGFVLEPDEAKKLITEDQRNVAVLFPYLNGQDLNSRPDLSASRWVINFHDWSIERSRNFEHVFDIIEDRVKAGRQRTTKGGEYVLRNPLPQKYWHYADKRPAMLRAIDGLANIIVITLVSKTVMPVLVPTGQVFSHALGVFATDDVAILALLSSAPHYWWARARASSMKADLRYTPSDVFETLPLPGLTQEMRDLGERLDSYRREVMLARQSGLTKTYNMVFDKGNNDEDIVELRRIHRAIDEATIRAYGWDDLLEQGLDHGFHLVAGREPRYTVGPALQRELVDRLLELNHERYAEEKAAGLHDKKKGRRKSRTGDGTAALF